MDFFIIETKFHDVEFRTKFQQFACTFNIKSRNESIFAY